MASNVEMQQGSPFAEAMVAAASSSANAPPAAVFKYRSEAAGRQTSMPAPPAVRLHASESGSVRQHASEQGHQRRISVSGRAMRLQALSCASDNVDLLHHEHGPGGHGDAEGDVEAIESSEPLVSFREAVITLVINCIGGGIVLFPNMMASAGIVPATLLCMVGCFCCLECGVLIADACAAVEGARGMVIRSYESLAFELGGPWFKGALIVTKNSAMLGFIIVYMSFVVDSVASMMADTSGEWAPNKTHIRFGLVLPIFCGLAMITDVSQLAKLADLASVAVGVVIGGVVAGSIWRAQLVPACSEEVALKCRAYEVFEKTDGIVGQLLLCGRTTAFVVFTFAMLGTVPTLRSQLDDRANMPAVLRLSFIIILACYLLVMFVGYYGFAEDAPANALTGLATVEPTFPTISSAGAAAMIVNILLGAPIFIICVVSVFEASGTSAIFVPLSKPNVLMRLTLMFALAFVSWVVPYVKAMIGIVSSVFGVCNNIFFPLTLYYLARGMLPKAPSAPRRAVHAVIFLIGLMVLAFGFIGSVDNLLTLLKAEKDTGRQVE